MWAGALVVAALATPSAFAQEPKAEPATFSQAERLLLMSNQLAKIKPPQTLSYRFQRSGSLEPAFDDRVSLRLKAKAGGVCCTVDGDFLTGARRLDLPPVGDAEGNPVTLFFLENDIREMKRLTKGSTYYFRKRIRMALSDAASVQPVQFKYRGQTVQGEQILVEPYRDDPNRAKFESLVRKQYAFTLSDAVPGAIAAIRAVAMPATGTDAVLRDELVLDGVEPPPFGAMPPTPSPVTK